MGGEKGNGNAGRMGDGKTGWMGDANGDLRGYRKGATVGDHMVPTTSRTGRRECTAAV